MHPHADGGAVAFWYNNDDNDLYAAHVDFHGSIGTSGVDENRPSTGLQWPNPTTGQVRVRVMDRLCRAPTRCRTPPEGPCARARWRVRPLSI